MGSTCACPCHGTPSSQSKGQVDFEPDKHTKKILLLGIGSCGKSTLFKKLRSIKNGGITIEERESTRATIRQNIVHTIIVLAQQTQVIQDLVTDTNKDDAKSTKKTNDESNTSILDDAKRKRLKQIFEGCFVEITPYLNDQLKIIMDYVDDDFCSEDVIDFDFLKQLGLAIKYCWNLKEIENIYRKRGVLFSLPNNMDYFLDNVEAIMSKNYLPNEKDCLFARARTIGK